MKSKDVWQVNSQTRTSARTNSKRFRTAGGGWSFAIAQELLKVYGDWIDPTTFSHDQLAEIIQGLDREGGRVSAQAVRYDLEWLLWDRDGLLHRGRDRHLRAA